MTQSMPTTGRWGWYRDHEGREFRRVSKLLEYGETRPALWHLDRWKMRQVLVGAARRDDLITAVKAMGSPDPVTGWTREQKALQDELVQKASEAAKDTDGAITGTAMHTLTERVDRGEPIDKVAAGLPTLLGETIRAYAALRQLNGWRTIEIERTVVCDELEVAGTLDRCDFVPGLAALLGPGTCQYGHDWHDVGATRPEGLPVIVDVKTEEKPWMNGLHIGPQLAIYSRAKRMWSLAGYVPAPCVRQDVAIVVHLRDGVATPLFVDLAEGWQAAVAAYEQMKRETRAKRAMGAKGAWFAPVPNIVRPKAAQTLVEHAAAEGYADPSRPALRAVAEHMAGGGSTTEGIGAVLVGAMDAERAPVLPVLAFPAAQHAVGDTVTVGGVGFVKHSEGSSGADIVGGHGPMPAGDSITPGLDSVKRQLIDAIWQAVTLDGLAILWNMARDRSVPWTGPVAAAADARRRQVECPQRQMAHVPGTAKCACGWTPAVPA